jgi:hypothetical protein
MTIVVLSLIPGTRQSEHRSSGVQALHRQRAALDAKVAALYREGRQGNINIPVLKIIVRDLHGEAVSVDEIWRLYARQLGLTDADIAADADSRLDQILGQI